MQDKHPGSQVMSFAKKYLVVKLICACMLTPEFLLKAVGMELHEVSEKKANCHSSKNFNGHTVK